MVTQISDNEIYLLIKYIKSVLWRVAKSLSYTEDARCLKVNADRGSVAGIASTCYGLDGPGIESQWGRDSPHYPDRQWGPPSLLDNGYWVSLPGEKRAGHDVDPPSRAEVN